MSQDVLQGLESIRSSVRQRLMGNPDFRALMSIERTIAEIAELSEASSMEHRREPVPVAPSDLDGFIPAEEPMPSSASVLESIAAKAVSSAAARSLSPFGSAPRVAQVRR